MFYLKMDFVWAVDQSGVSPPDVIVKVDLFIYLFIHQVFIYLIKVDEVTVGSFSSHFCIPESSNVSIHCKATIEQGKDVEMNWLLTVKFFKVHYNQGECRLYLSLLVLCRIIKMLWFVNKTNPWINGRLYLTFLHSLINENYPYIPCKEVAFHIKSTVCSIFNVWP